MNPDTKVQWTAIIEEHSASPGRLIPRTVITFMFADMVDGRIAEALDHLLDNHCDEMWEAGWNTERLTWLLPTHRLVARAAPDLLAVAEGLLKYSHEAGCAEVDLEVENLIDDASAAIAKAKGCEG